MPSSVDDVTRELERELEAQLRQLEGKPALPQDAPEPEEESELPGVGAIVETRRLSKAEHNGLRGKVLRHQKAPGDDTIRVVVSLPPPLGEKALRQTNLVTIVEAPSGDGSIHDPSAKRYRAGGGEPEDMEWFFQPPPNWKGIAKGEYDPAIEYWDKFNTETKILVVGEGNFSWAWNMCHIIGTGQNMVCTDACVNSTVRQTASQYLLPLIEAGATITMRLDATRMGKQALVKRCGQYFDRVVWNFPHTSTPNKAAYSHQEHIHLLTVYLQQAQEVLHPGGQASITVKDGYPYCEWGIGKLQPGGRMHYLGCQTFTPERFSIYSHVTTRAGAGVGGSSQIARVFPAHTYVYEYR